MNIKVIIYLLILLSFVSESYSQTGSNDQGNNSASYESVSVWRDGSPMTKEKVDGVIYIKKENKFYKRNYSGKLNVKWFGAKGDGKTDDSKAIQAAFDYGESLFFPAGKYKFNARLNQHMELEGDAGNTYLMPFDIKRAIIIYNAKAPFWTYSSSMVNMIVSSNNKEGTGISFGTDINGKQEPDGQYSGNVTFRNVLFQGFDKAITFPWGNIGCTFFSCSFQQNRYGVYSLDNKGSGDNMHAGNKYFYTCEFDSNDIAVYFHNLTDGFGGVSFTDCIFQFNLINGFFYSNNTYTPVSFINCWDEKRLGDMSKSVNVDVFDNKKLSSKKYQSTSYIFDGKDCSYNFIGGRLTNIDIRGKNIVVNAYSSKVEYSKGVSSAPFSIAATSFLNLYYPSTDGGLQSISGIRLIGFPTLKNNMIQVSETKSETRYLPLQDDFAMPGMVEHFSVNFNKAINLNGSFLPEKPETLPTSNKTFSGQLVKLAFSEKNQYILVENSKITLKPGYYFIFIKTRISQGDPMLFVWDRNLVQFVSFSPFLDGKSHNYGAYGYLPSTSEIFLDISSNDGKKVELLLEKYEIYKFDSLNELKEFFIKNNNDSK
ncbi:glycosyl hydrolase family 28-related protein [Sphingobacterium spiritivorum]|uniref:glycosyl hydrolase family 28-related protein n=1 Tax=Sphingobacterium spiritivorum TaxID=258 RepID=UPI00191A463D|nr:glycosyl hydrolase family 28-related protein [Sphingobacterium spiritivorum]QQT27812.1 hypothetical protein I6J02_08210 [Sphingobacterium spiritivorum]